LRALRANHFEGIDVPDITTIVMFGLIGLLIFFMFRNGRKRQAQQQEMQRKMVPGAEVMLQSGIYATIDSIDEETNKVTVRSGTSTFIVHRNAIGQVVMSSDAVEPETEEHTLAPDDDPAFGERVGAAGSTDSAAIEEIKPVDGTETKPVADEHEDKGSDKE